MDDDFPIFEAILSETSAAPVVRLLNTVLIGEKPTALCLFQILPDKIKVTLETNRVLQGTATLPSALFSPYTLHSQEKVDLKVNLKSLLSGINLYTDCSADDRMALLSEPDVPFTLGFKLVDEASKLNITIISNGHATGVEVTALATTLDFPLFSAIRDSDFICHLTIDAAVLVEIWHLFDQSCDKISVRAEKKSFSFFMEGIHGSTRLEMDRNHASVNKFTCSLTSAVSWTYRAALLKKAIRPVCIANHNAIVNIKLSSEGFFSIQYELDVADQGDAYIEYLYRPIAEDTNGDVDLNSSV